MPNIGKETKFQISFHAWDNYKKKNTHVKYTQFGGPIAPPFSVRYVGSQNANVAKLSSTIVRPDSVICVVVYAHTIRDVYI